jgi:hypothetical protein
MTRFLAFHLPHLSFQRRLESMFFLDARLHGHDNMSYWPIQMPKL